MDFEDNNPLSLSEGEPISVIDELMGDSRGPDKMNDAQLNLNGDTAYIVDASKSREGTKRGHITYTIRLGKISVRRRYSEFESLRRTLRRMYPTVIIPPIPEKHSITAYAASPAHAQEDAKVIDHRRRMLALFLNRCLQIPSISESLVFKRFLDPNVFWSEVLTSDLVASVPKSPLQAPPLNPGGATPAHVHLPVPPSGARLRQDPLPELLAAEASVKEYEALFGLRLDKTTRHLLKQYSALSSDCADLGGQFNAFSLESSSSVASAVEKVGQALDTGYLSTEALMERLEIEFSEPLGESVQMAATTRQVLKYRRYRALQVEMVKESLKARQADLAALEVDETEAQRINSILHADERIDAALTGTKSAETRATAVSNDASSATAEGDLAESAENISMLDPADEEGASMGMSKLFPGASTSSGDSSQSSSSKPRAASGTRKAGFRLPGFSQLNHAIHGMMDVDPEASRRNNISRTQSQIANLEGALEVAKEDNEVTSKAVKEELARYNNIKEQDLKRMVEVFIQCHIEWAEKNLQAWLDARQAISD